MDFLEFLRRLLNKSNLNYTCLVTAWITNTKRVKWTIFWMNAMNNIHLKEQLPADVFWSCMTDLCSGSPFHFIRAVVFEQGSFCLLPSRSEVRKDSALSKKKKKQFLPNQFIVDYALIFVFLCTDLLHYPEVLIHI